MAKLTDLYLKSRRDPQWESEHVSKRPLRGPQAEIISKLERHISAHQGGVATVMCSRQTGKNDIAAALQRRHLWRHQNSRETKSWIRTAPTYKPQIINSKKRLRELLQLDTAKRIQHPLFHGAKLIQEEGYIWRLGNATVEFISSGPNANVVGATASECLDMDEAHKVNQDKFDEDFAPFTASTNAGTILWGVASNGLDTLEFYREKNRADGNDHLNLYYPCEIWMEILPAYAAHVESRAKALGWDHHIIKTQYRLISVAAEGRYLSQTHLLNLFSGKHLRQLSPTPGVSYQMVIDIAGGNEDFNPDNMLEGDEDTSTDSTVIWIYEVSSLVASNGLFPIIRIVNMIWLTGVDLPVQEVEIRSTIERWKPSKVTVDAVGIGRQIAESLENHYGTEGINKYIANGTSVSEDCFDLQARLNFSAVQMFTDDGSPEWSEFKRQCEWTKYASSQGKMKLMKPKADRHIDMVKALTYINRNSPVGGVAEMYAIEGDFSAGY